MMYRSRFFYLRERRSAFVCMTLTKKAWKSCSFRSPVACCFSTLPETHENTATSTRQESTRQSQNVQEKQQQQSKAFDNVDDKPPPKRDFFGRFFDRMKTTWEDEKYAPIPSEFPFPMVKGLVVNKFDPAMLVYPEFDESPDIVALEDRASKIGHELIDALQNNEDGILSTATLNRCKELGLFGLQIPKEYGGLGLNHKSLIRYYEELSRDWSLFTILHCHNDLAAKCIHLYGTEAQRAKYLPRLASGESKGAFCSHEPCSGQDMASSQTVAYRQSDTVAVNGFKSWVTNGFDSDILVVFVKLRNSMDLRVSGELSASTAVIVDRKNIISGEIQDVERKDTIGLNGVNISGIKFNDVVIPDDCILGIPETGFPMALQTINSNRYVFAIGVAACLKRCLSAAIRHCNTTKRWGVLLSDSVAIQAKIANVSKAIYSLESCSYFIAGWLDDDSSKDFSLEGALLTRYARRLFRQGILDLMEIYGAEARTTDLPLERLLRDCFTLSGYMSTDDYISGYVAMECYKEYATEHKATLFQVKKALDFPMASRSDFYQRNRIYNEVWKQLHHLEEHVHPSLEYAAKCVEETLHKMDLILKQSLYASAKEIEHEHQTLTIVSDILTDLFVMISCISRASRSHCIGLRNSDFEITLADMVCTELKYDVFHLLQFCIYGDSANVNDVDAKKIAKLFLESKAYVIERPLTKNW